MQTRRGKVQGVLRRAEAVTRRLGAGHADHRLPPGELDSLDELEKADRAALQRRAERLGPVFKGLVGDERTVCIVGLARCRRFLKDHGDDVEIVTQDLTAMFPGGFLRAMSGDTHRDYRRALVRAVRSADGDVALAEFESLAAAELRRYATTSAQHQNRPEAWTSSLSDVSTGLLVRTFFGASPGSATHASLVEGFRDLGPYGLVWNPQARQHAAFGRLCLDLRTELVARHEGRSEMSPTCLLAALDDDGELDETMLGNLIYMVEMGRSDIHNFLRWLSRYVASDQALCDAIALGDTTHGVRTLEEALVLEVLRADQSERLERRTLAEVTFEGYVIPAGTHLRLCMWEAHHDAAAFADPHVFDPSRFLHATPSSDVFAPFGLDHHQCPFGALTTRIGTSFVRALCAYRPTLLADGPPVRGAYHWEPSRRLAVELVPR
ncbi:MAG: ent-kaurenoic acid hydroxylase [Acidimicrobiaceae bacterium]|jgi:cytochrome P450|nr:MAG: ent-kaurenoic acid hydroxylase [Acidimicrobiaceae bacterium]